MKYTLLAMLACTSIFGAETYPEEWESIQGCAKCQLIRARVFYLQNETFDELYNNQGIGIENSIYDVKLSGKIEAYQDVLNSLKYIQ